MATTEMTLRVRIEGPYRVDPSEIDAVVEEAVEDTFFGTHCTTEVVEVEEV